MKPGRCHANNRNNGTIVAFLVDDMMRTPPGAYMVTTGATLSPDEASCNLFPPDALVVHVDTHRHGPLVTYVYMIDYIEAPAS